MDEGIAKLWLVYGHVFQYIYFTNVGHLWAMDDYIWFSNGSDNNGVPVSRVNVHLFLQ